MDNYTLMTNKYNINEYDINSNNNKEQYTYKNQKQTHEYSLKQNNFNPIKGSPNLFITKLEFRLKNYHLEMELEKDNFSLYQK
jgi:hypothetical protein